jgi:flavin reductase (DIM6/NTAB) family NADH-FMN oxidoreductase RutF
MTLDILKKPVLPNKAAVQTQAQAQVQVQAQAQSASASGDSPLDTKALRSCLGQMATGITVISTRAADGTLVGLTANSFGALSLDPPLIIWSLRLASPNLPVFQKQERFVVSVLAEAQTDISRQFASSQVDKFSGIAYALNTHGVPLLHGASAWFECRTVTQHIAGDHCLFIAQVERFSQSDAAPLLYHGGGYFGLGSRL